MQFGRNDIKKTHRTTDPKCLADDIRLLIIVINDGETPLDHVGLDLHPWHNAVVTLRPFGEHWIDEL